MRCNQDTAIMAMLEAWCGRPPKHTAEAAASMQGDSYEGAVYTLIIIAAHFHEALAIAKLRQAQKQYK